MFAQDTGDVIVDWACSINNTGMLNHRRRRGLLEDLGMRLWPGHEHAMACHTIEHSAWTGLDMSRVWWQASGQEEMAAGIEEGGSWSTQAGGSSPGRRLGWCSDDDTQELMTRR